MEQELTILNNNELDTDSQIILTQHSEVKYTKVLLLNPPFSLEKRYGKSIAKIGTVIIPLGMGYVAAMIEKARYPINVLDCQAENIDKDGIVKYCEQGKFDVIGVYCNTSNFQSTKELCRTILEVLPNVKFIVGGPQAFNEKIGTLDNDIVDYMIYGEAEETFVELLNAIEYKWNDEKKSAILGLGYKSVESKIIINPPRAFIKNLDSLPFPARHLFNLKLYRPSPNQYKRLPYFSIMASRGCPYSCTFCNIVNMWERKYRIRSPDNVIAEMRELKEKYGARDIAFWDDIFGLSKKWLYEFCNKLIESKLGLVWDCLLRVDLVDFDTLKLMKKAGCWMIFYGVESLDDDILKAIDKKATAEQNLRAIELTKKAGIEVRANMMVGLPNETPEKLKRSVKLLCKANPDYVKFNITTPYPGTKLYDQVKEGMWGTMIDDMEKYTHYNATFLPNGYKDLKEVERMRRYAFTKFYLRPSYIIPKILSIRSMTDIRRYYDGFSAVKSLALSIIK
ncbi:MAG: radical SAM protein [Nanoarchaeota archaeon]